MHEVQFIVDYLTKLIAVIYGASTDPVWPLIKNLSCAWVAASIMRFRPCAGMAFRFKTSMSATLLFMLCIMELSMVMTGSDNRVSPFIALIMLLLGYRLHVAKGNVAKLKMA